VNTPSNIKILKLRNMLERRKLINTIQRIKAKQQPVNKIPAIFLKMRMQPQPFFANAATNNDLFSAFNADMGHGDDLFGSENYYDENFYDEEYYQEDYFNDAGIDWVKLRRREGNPLLW